MADAEVGDEDDLASTQASVCTHAHTPDVVDLTGSQEEEDGDVPMESEAAIRPIDVEEEVATGVSIDETRNAASIDSETSDSDSEPYTSDPNWNERRRSLSSYDKRRAVVLAAIQADRCATSKSVKRLTFHLRGSSSDPTQLIHGWLRLTDERLKWGGKEILVYKGDLIKVVRPIRISAIPATHPSS